MKDAIKNTLAGCLVAKGINQSQLARRFDLSRAHVSRLIKGNAQPSLDLALRMATYFKKPVEEIFQLVESGQPVISSPCPAADRNHK